MTTLTASSMADAPSTFRSLYWPVAIVLALLLGLLWLLGYGPGGSACALPTVASTAAAAKSAAAPTVAPPVAKVATPATTPAPATTPTATPAVAASAATPTTTAAAAAATAAAATAAAAKPTTQAIAPLPPTAKVYFDTAKFDVKPAERSKMNAVIAYLKANPTARGVISGFHDSRGDKAKNVDLAHNRARAVRAQLEAAGIARDRVEMAKPQETTGDGSLQEARRVELSVEH